MPRLGSTTVLGSAWPQRSDRGSRRGLLATPAAAQQRPLVTEDPEPIGAGRLLIEGGVDFAVDQQYPVSGLRGRPVADSDARPEHRHQPIAELQIDGGFYNQFVDRLARCRARRWHPCCTVDGDSHERHRGPGDRRRRSACMSERANRPSFARPLRDEAAEREQRERTRSRHDRFLRVAARREDRAVDTHRRQSRAGHPGGSHRRATARTTC